MLGKQEKKKILQLSPESILPNPSQPRKHFPQEELESLAESIRRNGLLQPVTVRKGEKGWELVAGERRLRASKIAGMETIPCIVCSCSEEQSAIFAMIENLQRQDLDPFELCCSFLKDADEEEKAILREVINAAKEGNRG